MTGRRVQSKPQAQCKVTSTQEDFVHECTCNVALKQFSKDMRQLESNTRPSGNPKSCNGCKKHTSSFCIPLGIERSSRRTKPVTKPLPQTPSKNRTWFEVLADSPQKPRERNEVSGCDPSCKYSSIFSNPTVPKYDDDVRSTKAQQFGLLMDILNDRIAETNDRELLNVVNKMNNLIHPSKTQQFRTINSQRNENAKNSPNSSLQDARHTLRRKLQEMEKPIEKSNKEKDDIKLKALLKLLDNMQSVNEKTGPHQESLKHLTDLINKLFEENKILNEQKDKRLAVESKLAHAVTENKYLKERVHLLEIECKKSHRLLEAKDDEIANLKNRVGQIRETIERKIDFGVHPELDHRSITLDFDDTVASVPSCHENFDALIRPASSSPARSIDRPVKQNVLRRMEDDDSGIQSNAQETEKNSRRLPYNYKNAILELKDNVRKAMDEFRVDTRLNDVSLDLSDATYKCSFS